MYEYEMRTPYPNELMHYGIMGMKWGVRNGPPYPLGSSSMSTSEKKKDRLKGFSDEEKAEMRKIAKIAGVSLATTAGVLAVGYLYVNRNRFRSGFQVTSGLHKYYSFNLGPKLFNNKSNGDYVGKKARELGYHAVDAESLEYAFSHKTTSPMDYDALTHNVRENVLSGPNDRRLSCWSTAHAYYTSAITGEQFCSKNFQNAVNQNDFKKLYTDGLKVYDINGNVQTNAATRFVGYFGINSGHRCDVQDIKKLTRNVFKNVSDLDNLSADGTRTIGFMEGAYRSVTCSHQWNFEIAKTSNGVRELFIVDAYGGDRYRLARQVGNKIMYNTMSLAQFSAEMAHYNAESIRFYAPNPDQLNLDMLQHVILGK